MFICQSCYNDRGERALVHDIHKAQCQFCEKTDQKCYDIPIWQLNHWTEVAKFQGWR